MRLHALGLSQGWLFNTSEPLSVDVKAEAQALFQSMMKEKQS